uniref:Nuclear protein MDM1 n=1 Tax=Scleropages formosus TaxID=113540 RepID=A0A8C9THL2_SCLFO
PVQGVSEYQKKFKGQTAQSGGASFHPGTRQAGLRSDQLGITKEPQFLSKKKVPLHRPQVSRSLECKELVDPQWHPQDLEVHRPSPPLAETPERPGNSREPQASLASRGLQPPEILSTHHALDALPHLTPPEPEEPKQLTKDHKGGLYSSEYQRQFLWKAPAVSSPLLAAEQVLTPYFSHVIPPFKTDPLILESEYRRNFRGSPPPQGPRLHRDLEDREGALFQSENVSPESAAKVVSSWSTVVFLQSSVRELREKAEAYRKRAWGTHFSRDHLSQILSEHNQLWEASTTSSAVMDLHAGVLASFRTGNINDTPGIQHLSLESISDTSRDEGRVPTPKLKTIAVVPRTHHDLTTPVTGNHSSAPEIYFCTSFCSSMKLTLYSGSVQVSPAVGLSTLDPIPLREDFLETELHPEDPPAPCHDRSFQKHNGCGPSHLSITAPAVRIQGKLRDPEFQHNVPSAHLLPHQRLKHPRPLMSLISSMSAASCSFASQVLARAQKRKEDFWGKN